MGEMSSYWKDVAQDKKQQHQDRVAKTPDRIKWCQQQFEKLGMNFKLVNDETGQFNAKIAKKTIVYYCSTGTVMVSGRKMEGRGFKYACRLYRKLWEES